MVLSAETFFDLDRSGHQDLLGGPNEPVWKALDRLKDYLAACFESPWPLAGKTGPIEGEPLVIVDGEVRSGLQVRPTGPKGKVRAFQGEEPVDGAAIIMVGAYLFDDRLILGPGTVVEPGALVKGPTVVGKDTEIRQGAYIRGTCLVGDGCVVGHTTETKGAVMLDGAKAGHFAYVGDSILGCDVNLGAGTKLANLKMIAGNVMVRAGSERLDTGRRKLGAILGDKTETGCNSVTSPGTLVGKNSIIYPTVAVASGYYAAKTYFRPHRDSVSVHTVGR